MKARRKTLLVTLCVLLMVAASILGTLAYLTDDAAVTNTFTVGTVKLKLDEAVVDDNGKAVNPESRTEEGNPYHLLPGHTYDKDPTVTILEESEESYVRMIVTLNYAKELKAIFGEGFLPQNYVQGWNPEVWASTNKVKEESNTLTYEFRYVGSEYQGTKAGTVKKANSDIVLPDLFTSFTLPGQITKEQLATLVTKDEEGKITDQFKIVVTAHAIQADGFNNADDAWKAFEGNDE